MLKIGNGTTVEISLINPTDDAKQYSSTVEGLLDKETVLIRTPATYGVYAKLLPNEVYTLKFESESETFVYRSSVIKNVHNNQMQFTEFRLIGDGKRLRQRGFFRCACNIPALFSLSEFDESGALVPHGYKKGSILNLSGGGLVLASRFEVHNGNLIFLSFNLDDIKMNTLGEVRRKTIYDFNMPNPYQYGVMFVGIGRVDQDKIVRYLYRQQGMMHSDSLS